MKYYFFILLLIASAVTGFSQKEDKFTLKGYLSKYAGNKEPLIVHFGRHFNGNGELIIEDSCKFTNGKFNFKGTAPEPFMGTIHLINDSGIFGDTVIGRLRLWVEKGNIYITGNDGIENAVIKGSHTQALSEQYNRQISPFKKRIQELFDLKYARPTDSVFYSSFFKPELRKAGDSIEAIRKQLIIDNPKNFYSLFLLKDDLLWQMRSQKSLNSLTKNMVTEVEELYNGLDPQLIQSAVGKQTKKELLGLSAADIGDPVLHFTLKGIDGNMVDTRKLIGRVFLVDFWGSWCKPCRASHPHLKDLYKSYKDKGFEIVAVAVEYGNEEQQHQNWKKAVKEDAIPWLHVLNGKEDNDLVMGYGIGAFPTKILVNRDGKVLLRVTDDEKKELDLMLKELFQ